MEERSSLETNSNEGKKVEKKTIIIDTLLIIDKICSNLKSGEIFDNEHEKMKQSKKELMETLILEYAMTELRGEEENNKIESLDKQKMILEREIKIMKNGKKDIEEKIVQKSEFIMEGWENINAVLDLPKDINEGNFLEMIEEYKDYFRGVDQKTKEEAIRVIREESLKRNDFNKRNIYRNGIEIIRKYLKEDKQKDIIKKIIEEKTNEETIVDENMIEEEINKDTMIKKNPVSRAKERNEEARKNRIIGKENLKKICENKLKPELETFKENFEKKAQAFIKKVFKKNIDLNEGWLSIPIFWEEVQEEYLQVAARARETLIDNRTAGDLIGGKEYERIKANIAKAVQMAEIDPTKALLNFRIDHETIIDNITTIKKLYINTIYGKPLR